MEDILSNPLAQFFALPFLASFGAVAFIYIIFKERRGNILAGLGVGVGFILAYIFIVGRPPFPPIASSHKLFYLTIIGFAGGLIVDFVKDRQHMRRVVAMAFPMMTAYWLAYSQFNGTVLSPPVIKFLVITILGGIIMVRLDKLAERGLTASIMVLFAAVGLGVISNSTSISQLSFALVASLGAFVAWNWPVKRMVFSGILLIGAGGVFMVLISQTLYFTPTSLLAQALLIPIFFADLLVGKFMAGKDRVAMMIKPIVLAILCALPVGAAVFADKFLN